MIRTPRAQKAFVLAVSVVLALALPLSAAASDRWFHVHVDDRPSGGAEVSVNLPLSLIDSALKLIPESVSRKLSTELGIELNDAGFSLDELRDLWSDIRDGDDATYLTVRDNDVSFQVRKSGDFLLVESDESSDTQIDVRFPLPVVDALLSSPDGPLDFSAAIHPLAEYDDGNMVTIRDRDTTVRVSVDSSNTQ
jgi:hypothetical protein